MGSGRSPCNLLKRALSWCTRPFISCWPLWEHTCSGGGQRPGAQATPLLGAQRKPLHTAQEPACQGGAASHSGWGGGGAEPVQGGGVSTGLRFPDQHPGREAPRRAPRPHQPARRPTERRALPVKPLLSGQRARRRPSRVTRGMRLAEPGHPVPQGLPKCRQGVEECPGAPHRCPGLPIHPAPPASYLGSPRRRRRRWPRCQ